VGISSNGRHALIRVTTTGYTDAWLAVVDLPSLATRVVAHLHDDAWLDGPLSTTAGWLKDGETVYYGSEETGYAHLYTVPAAGGAPRALTRGAWEVQQVALAPDGKTFYLHTNDGDFGQVHCYALDIATGRKTQLTSAEGRQDVEVSPYRDAREPRGGAVRARRRLSPERAQVVVVVLPGIHVQPAARLEGLRRARSRLPRQRRAGARLAHRDLPPHGREGPGRPGRR